MVRMHRPRGNSTWIEGLFAGSMDNSQRVHSSPVPSGVPVFFTSSFLFPPCTPSPCIYPLCVSCSVHLLLLHSILRQSFPSFVLHYPAQRATTLWAEMCPKVDLMYSTRSRFVDISAPATWVTQFSGAVPSNASRFTGSARCVLDCPFDSAGTDDFAFALAVVHHAGW